jgi:hypothetical protein
MAVATHETLIPKVALRALIELTGQSQVDVALLMTLRDAVEHRLEKIGSALQDYEQKYGMTFQQFEAQARTGEIPDRFSYEKEKDYFEWDSLVTRKRKLEEIQRWLV